jgi:hypothetical protein
MSPMTHLRLAGLSFVMLTIAAQAQGKLEGRGAAQRFVSEKYGFSISIPTGWRVELPVDRLLLYNYPASRALPQGRLPEGGAQIAVIMKETLSGGRLYGNSLSEWAANNMRIETDGTPASPEPFEMPRESGTMNAITLSYDTAIFGIGQQGQHMVTVYWEFERKFFAAYLYYVANDPKGAAVEKVFLNTVRTLRPLRRPNKR